MTSSSKQIQITPVLGVALCLALAATTCLKAAKFFRLHVSKTQLP
jgi:preprotein translocase subunit Sec61beta